jgi:hypothetical protein
MPDLEQIQRWFQAVIMHPGGAVEGIGSQEARSAIPVPTEQVEQVVGRSRALTGLDRLEIYQRAYYARLLECLREEFPVLAHALGEDTFNEFAVAYLQQYPSHSYTLNQLGVLFASYLAESRPGQSARNSGTLDWSEFVINLATLERTYAEVFDGPGVEGQPLLQTEQLVGISPDEWMQATIKPVCCLRLLQLHYPVHTYYSAVRKRESPGVPRHRTTYLAVTRRQFIVRRYQLTSVQHTLLAALAGGETVGQALARAAVGRGLDWLSVRVPKWFHNWAAEGFFESVRRPGPTT